MSHGILLSVIAPTAYLRELADQVEPTLHYLAAQRVLADERYRDFYREQAERGAHLVLDNGVFDLGTALDADDLVRAARLVRAREIVLPDVLHDGAATVAATDAAAAALARHGDEFMYCAVVQGASDGDWSACYDALAGRSYITALALPSPKRRGDTESLSYDRLYAATHLDASGLVRPNLTYRLLGLGDSAHIELAALRRFAWIQSVDCSLPLLMGALGMRIVTGEPFIKPSVRVDELGSIPPDRIELARENVRTLRAAAGCPLRLVDVAVWP